MAKQRELSSIHSLSSFAEQEEGSPLPTIDDTNTPLPRVELTTPLKLQAPLPRYFPTRWIEIVQRLDQNLNQIFEKLTNTLGRSFDKEKIIGVVFFRLDLALEKQPEVEELSRRYEHLVSIEHKVNSFLKDMEAEGNTFSIIDDTWRFLQKTMREVETIRDGTRAQIEKEGERKIGWQKLRDRRCRVLSDIATDLADYLWFQFPNSRPSQCYRIIGDILTQISSPSCFVCGEQHLYPEWRNIRQLDRFGDQWEDRESIIRAHQERDWRAFYQSLGYSPGQISAKLEEFHKEPFSITSTAFDEPVLERHYKTRIMPARMVVAASSSQ
jgi:hypothetical protein